MGCNASKINAHVIAQQQSTAFAAKTTMTSTHRKPNKQVSIAEKDPSVIDEINSNEQIHAEQQKNTRESCTVSAIHADVHEEARIHDVNQIESKEIDPHPKEANKTITIIHFNDVYNIEARDQEPVGGAARFVTKVKEYANEDPLVFFSGDCLNPSLSKLLFDIEVHVLFYKKLVYKKLILRWPKF